MRQPDLQRFGAKLDQDKWERHLETRLKQLGIPFVRQFKWAVQNQIDGLEFPHDARGKPRGWVSDFYIVPNILIEVDGQVWQKAGHTSGTGYTQDRERDNEALCYGYITVRVTSKQVEDDLAIDWIERVMKRHDKARSGGGQLQRVDSGSVPPEQGS
jgi:very-short-patch-repair endonuclease